MSGKRLLLDTNAIIQLLAGNEELLEIAEQADFVSTDNPRNGEINWRDARRTARARPRDRV